MNVVGKVSAYKEGTLVRAAIESVLRVGLDRLYIFEGPAGEPLGDDVPDSEYPPLTSLDGISGMPVRLQTNRWRTDARKRNAMLQEAKTDFPGPLWGVIVDADEVLVNGEYLRDRLQSVMWQDEIDGAPTARLPLHLVEHDGGMHLITARVIRCDLVRSIDHSSSVVTNTAGVQEGWGNLAARSAVWIEGWLAAIDRGQMIAWPPLPCEPHIVHRSNLRHPARKRLRMSEQEAVEFAKAQAAEKNGGA